MTQSCMNRLKFRSILYRGAEATYTEAVLYHSVGPDASKIRSSHVYVGDPPRNGAYKHDTTSYELEGMDTECCVYENPDAKVRYL